MKIEIHCEKCGYLFRVPRTSAGQWDKCPHCNNEIYIATPESEIEELPLAPEDTADSLREKELLAEQLRLDRALREEEGTAMGESTAAPAGKASSTGRTSVQGVVTAYLAAMRQSDLTKAKRALAFLASRRAEALQYVDQLIADQIPPVELADVPPAVYQGFLKTLRARL